MKHSTVRHWHRSLSAAWSALRSLLGDDGYERYVAHAMRAHPGQSALTRREFYDAELRRKWSSVNRCC